MPLLGLRAFAEVGRHGSVKAAAAALGVTPGAVSQQLKTLEDRLGVMLFERGNREIHLTRAGQGLLGPVLKGFDRIEAALETFEARRRRRNAVLRVSTWSSFAATWLVPRLGRFTAAYPWIDLNLHVSPELVVIGRGPGAADIAIRHGMGRYDGLKAERLFQPRLVPVGSPDLLRKAAVRTPADCLRVPLLQDEDGTDWSMWLRAFGVADPDGRAFRGPRMADDYLLIRAAIAGQGLALVRDTYARSEIAAGRLALVLDAPQPQRFAYWLVTRPGSVKQKPALAAFRKWILAEAAEDRAMPAALGD
ncbi:MAG TPA: LysR substrate-binding domain-containing protein [Rhizomicrobium sp.]|jgi:LysR family glycine cleavage system transcriptional activator|nr:LysR substrate-binding domain-containing protein [Rhizomicrobium sp.]